MFFPYITGRNFAFRILIELALVLFIALAVLNKDYRPKMTPIVWAVLIFVGVVGIANLFGVDFYSSFWSRFERMEGYLMILHLAAYFFVLTNVFRTKRDWLTLFNLVVIAGILVGGYGVLQVLGLKEAIQGGGVRIDGTIGNPTYLAAYLTLVIALALVLFFNADKKWKKYFYGGAVVFSFFVMFFTASRGAALAMLVAIPLFLVLYLVFFRGVDDKEKLFKKLAIAALASMVLLPTLVWLLRATPMVQNSEVLSRLTSISFGERTVKSRFQIWGMAGKAFLERPLLGWGQENFIIAFSKYFDPRLYDQEPWFDRPHNIVFEWLINAGAFGLLSYLALFGAFYWGVAKLLKEKTIGKKEGIVLLVVPVAYFLQNFFVFDNFNTYVLFFGLLAYANSLLVHRPGEKESGEAKDPIPSLWVLVAGLIALGVIMYFVNFRAIPQASGIIRSLQATTDRTDPIGKTLNSFKETIGYGSFGTGETLEQLARVAGLLLGQGGVPAEQKKPFVEYAIGQLEKYVKENPQHIRLRLMLGSLYHAARSINPEYVFAAREEFKTALALSPKKQQILFVLADNYLATGEAEKALELIQQAADLEPSNHEAHVNLGIVAMVAGRTDALARALNSLDQLRLAAEPRQAQSATASYFADLAKVADAAVDLGQVRIAREIAARIRSLAAEAEELELENTQQEFLQSIESRIRE